jgi:chemotaxis response regulator CheB
VTVARVLLCDSADDVLLMLSMELGFHDDIDVVGAAHDGRSAVAIAERTRPDVVILGLDLPVLGGLDALRRITPRRASSCSSAPTASAWSPKP